MSRRLPGRFLACFLAVAMLAPLAVADHAYSHRMIIYGRVVDAAGNPAQGMTVDARFENFEYEGSCSPQQPRTETDAWGPTYTRPVTNEYGEFVFCLHTHGMSRFEPGTAILKVTNAQGAEEISEARFGLDGFTRVVFVTLDLPGTKDANSTLFDSTYTVAGRLWTDSGEQKVEGVTVFGDTVQLKNVSVSMTYNDGKTASATTRTNGYGDFSVRIPVTERPQSGTVTVTAENKTFTLTVDGRHAISTMTGTFEEPADPFVTKLLLGTGIVVGAAVVVAGGVFGYRKLSDNRATAAARERSQRKRAQK